MDGDGNADMTMPDQNTDNSKGGESARFKPTNAPKKEALLGDPEVTAEADDKSIADLREAIWQAIKSWDLERNRGLGYAGATGTDAQIILDAIEPIIAAHDRLLLDRVMGLIPDKPIYPETMDYVRMVQSASEQGKYDDMYENGFYKATAELRGGIARLRKGEA